jgi:hypothetical protein
MVIAFPSRNAVKAGDTISSALRNLLKSIQDRVMFDSSFYEQCGVSAPFDMLSPWAYLPAELGVISRIPPHLEQRFVERMGSIG